MYGFPKFITPTVLAPPRKINKYTRVTFIVTLKAMSVTTPIKYNATRTFRCPTLPAKYPPNNVPAIWPTHNIMLKDKLEVILKPELCIIFGNHVFKPYAIIIVQNMATQMAIVLKARLLVNSFLTGNPFPAVWAE